MNRRLHNLLVKYSLAALFLAAGLFGVTHFHRVANHVDHGPQVSTPVCSCHGHRHAPPADEPPASDSEHCHFCKLLSQLAAETPVAADLILSGLVLQADFDLVVANPVAITAVYMGRGPPVTSSTLSAV
ncbi:MAG: DUF2946 family protein [Pirellulaceae bacterium]